MPLSFNNEISSLILHNENHLGPLLLEDMSTQACPWILTWLLKLQAACHWQATGVLPKSIFLITRLIYCLVLMGIMLWWLQTCFLVYMMLRCLFCLNDSKYQFPLFLESGLEWLTFFITSKFSLSICQYITCILCAEIMKERIRCWKRGEERSIWKGTS